jgi:hypothetical protein
LGNLKEKDHYEGLDIDGTVILKPIMMPVCVNWMHPAQNKNQWWALVNMVINQGVP